MVKYIIYLFNFLGILVMSLFGGDVTLKMNAPLEVKAGTEFIIEITIQKNSIEGFARFQQELPAGFTAQAIENGGADFTFEMQKVKFFWLVLPTTEEIKIKYNVKVDNTIVGDFSINGLFSYIDGEKKSSDLEPFKIKILPADDLANTEKNQINTQNNLGISVKRQEPFINSKGEIMIYLLVNKGNLPADQFAKVQEIVPEGYQAISIDSKDAIFTYKNNEVKFLWMTLPSEQEFLISYKLIPNSGKASNNININGSLSYINDGITQTIDVEKTTEYIADKYPVNSDNNTAENIYNTTNIDTITKEPETNKNTKTKEKNVLYKVQIAAGHKKLPSIKGYFQKLNMTEKVSLEMHEGWLKYTVGKYNVYKDARDHRVNIWNNTKINDAFVSAYNNGQRITVQEALMVANQEWYK